MAVMEVHRANLINTTTMVGVPAAQTATVAYLFDNNRRVAFSSSGYNTTTAMTMTVAFNPPRVLSHLMLQNHNLKSFSIYADTTTNVILSTATNSATSTYLSFASMTVSTLVLTLTDTIVASREKSIGELVATERRYQFERNPAIQDFKYTTERKQIRHVMPDGGVALFNIMDKYRTALKLEFFSQTSYDALLSIYTDALPVFFVPFPTATGWDGKGFETNWSGDFDFRYSTNVKSPGYTGTIVFEETPSA